MTEQYSEFVKIRVTPTMLRELEQSATEQMLSISALVRQMIGRELGMIAAPRLLVDTPMLYGLGPDEVLEEQHGPRSAEEER